VAAFFSGGYFDQARLVLAVVAWLLVLVVALACARPLPAERAGRVALGGLLLLAAWVLISMAWTPLEGSAWHDAQRVALYGGALIAAQALLADRRAAWTVEPALVGGALLVAAYGLSERLLPGLVELQQSRAALGRLDQPLTYWNAEGSVMAVGLVLAVRLAGTPQRAAPVRAGAAAAAPWIGLALYLTLSRGALASVVVGLLVLAALDPGRAQLRAGVVTIAAAAIAGAASEVLDGVRTTGGSSGQGAAMLVLLLVLSAVAAALVWRLGRADDAVRAPTRLRVHPGVAAVAALVALGLGVAVAVSGAGREPPAAGGTPGAARLSSVGSNRGEYWRVALDVARDHPLAGDGSGSFEVDWARRRHISEGVHDAHSLVIETGAELGLVGLVALSLFLGGVAASVPAAFRRQPVLVVGPAAGLAAWLLHAQLDWLWEMPAATLNVLLLAGVVLGAARSAPPAPPRPAAGSPGPPHGEAA
jgi:O-Antigen ligase